MTKQKEEQAEQADPETIHMEARSLFAQWNI